MGATALIATAILPVNGYEQVASGPNKGLWFFTKVPVEGSPWAMANRVALTDSSDFWGIQPKSSNDVNVCTRAKVAPFLPKVIEHEGFPTGAAPSPVSHTGALRKELNARVPKVTEGIWSSVSENDLLSKATTAAQPAIDVSMARARDKENGGDVPPVPYCTFKYFPPPKK